MVFFRYLLYGYYCMISIAIIISSCGGAAAVGAARSSTADTTTYVNVHIPHNFYKDDTDGYDHRPSLFGFPKQKRDGTIAERVYYTKTDLCDPIISMDGKRTGYPARNVDHTTGKMYPWVAPYILMADRGNCTFVAKARNAQHAGATALLIADNACLCSDSECISQSNTNICETAEPIMADDGSGEDISIPAFLLFKLDADRIKQHLMGGSGGAGGSAGVGEDSATLSSSPPSVLLELSWSWQRRLAEDNDNTEQEQKKHFVEYNLWYTPGALHPAFFHDFATVAHALGDQAYFTPNVAILDGVSFGCMAKDPTGDDNDPCSTLCTNRGRYCAIPPSPVLSSSSATAAAGVAISGADVVKESLRELCIWRHCGSSDGIGSAWWTYMIEFSHRCRRTIGDEDCIQDAYRRAGVDGDLIERCIVDSGGLTNDSPNAFLDFQITSKTVNGIYSTPALSINGGLVQPPPRQQQLSVSNTLAAICDSYPQHAPSSSLPNICRKKCYICPDVLSCIATNGVCRAGISSANATASILPEDLPPIVEPLEERTVDYKNTAEATSAASTTSAASLATIPPDFNMSTSSFRVPTMDQAENMDSAYGDEMTILEGISNKTLFLAMLFVNMALVILVVILLVWVCLSRGKENDYKYKAVDPHPLG